MTSRWSFNSPIGVDATRFLEYPLPEGGRSDPQVEYLGSTHPLKGTVGVGGLGVSGFVGVGFLGLALAALLLGGLDVAGLGGVVSKIGFAASVGAGLVTGARLVNREVGANLVLEAQRDHDPRTLALDDIDVDDDVLGEGRYARVEAEQPRGTHQHGTVADR